MKAGGTRDGGGLFKETAASPSGIAGKYDGSARRKPGRPATAKEIESLVIRMAAENRDWGYLRIQGALWNLGHEQRPRNGTPPRFLVSIHAPRAGGDSIL